MGELLAFVIIVCDITGQSTTNFVEQSANYADYLYQHSAVSQPSPNPEDALWRALRIARGLLNLSEGQAAKAIHLLPRDIKQLEEGLKKFVPTAYLHFLHEQGIDLNSLFDKGGTRMRAGASEHVIGNIASDLTADEVNDLRALLRERKRTSPVAVAGASRNGDGAKLRKS